MSNHVEIRKFDPRTMKDSVVCVLIAKRGSGKSVLARDLLYFKRHLAAGVVMSGTEDGNGYYSSFVPDLFIYSEYDRAALERLVERQRRMSKAGTAQPVFVVMDDCLYDRKFLSDKVIRNIFMNGRHLSLFVLITAQYCYDLSPNLRANTDFVFVLRENLYREKLYKNFFTMVPSFDMFNSLMDSCTADYGCMVLDNSNPSTTWSDSVFWYKASPERKFKLGSPTYWGYSKQRYDRGYDDRVLEKKTGELKVRRVL